MFRSERDRALQGRFPLRQRLTGQSRTSDRYSDFRTRLVATSRKEASACAAECSRPSNLQQSVIERLHAEADPVHAAVRAAVAPCVRKRCPDSLPRSIPAAADKSSCAWKPPSRKSSCAVVRAVGVPPPKKIVCGRRYCRRLLGRRGEDPAALAEPSPRFAAKRLHAAAQLRQNRLAKARRLRRIGPLFVKRAVGTNPRAKRDVHIDVPPRIAAAAELSIVPSPIESTIAARLFRSIAFLVVSVGCAIASLGGAVALAQGLPPPAPPPPAPTPSVVYRAHNRNAIHDYPDQSGDRQADDQCARPRRHPSARRGERLAFAGPA